MDLDWIKVYGPLSLGWFFAWQLWQQNKLNDERYYKEKLKDVEAKITLDNSLSTLIQFLKEKLK